MTQEAKHTPAPWNFLNEPASMGKGIRNKGGYICFMNNVTKYSDQEQRYINETQEQIADGNLIAAAPELLDVLNDTMHILMDAAMKLDDVSGYSWIINKAQAAINKARGES